MRDDANDLPLFGWKPPVQMIPFPLNRRIGKIRDVARKMVEKRTERHAEYYEKQVNEALVGHLERLGVPKVEQVGQIACFWKEVEIEMARLSYRSGGAA